MNGNDDIKQAIRNAEVVKIDEVEFVKKPVSVITVTIIERGDMEMSPWVSSFSSRKKADAFAEKVKEKLRKYGVEDEVSVTIDSGELDDEMYLDWVDARWEPEEEEE